jgi:hypothetical protein
MEGKRPKHEEKTQKFQARVARPRLSKWSGSRHAHAHIELLVPNPNCHEDVLQFWDVRVPQTASEGLQTPENF